MRGLMAHTFFQRVELESNLAKAHQVKQGMMQELLIERKRVI